MKEWTFEENSILFKNKAPMYLFSRLRFTTISMNIEIVSVKQLPLFILSRWFPTYYVDDIFTIQLAKHIYIIIITCKNIVGLTSFYASFVNL